MRWVNVFKKTLFLEFFLHGLMQEFSHGYSSVDKI